MRNRQKVEQAVVASVLCLIALSGVILCPELEDVRIWFFGAIVLVYVAGLISEFRLSHLSAVGLVIYSATLMLSFVIDIWNNPPKDGCWLPKTAAGVLLLFALTLAILLARDTRVENGEALSNNERSTVACTGAATHPGEPTDEVFSLKTEERINQ